MLPVASVPDLLTACLRLNDTPRVLGSVAELAASDAGREVVVANGYLFVDIGVGKVVGTLGHGPNKDTDALVVAEAINVVADPHHGLIKAQRDLAAVGR